MVPEKKVSNTFSVGIYELLTYDRQGVGGGPGFQRVAVNPYRSGTDLQFSAAGHTKQLQTAGFQDQVKTWVRLDLEMISMGLFARIRQE